MENNTKLPQKKKKKDLWHDPAILLLSVHPKTLEVGSQRDNCIPMITEALFIIAKGWKQAKCPSMNEWIKKNMM